MRSFFWPPLLAAVVTATIAMFGAAARSRGAGLIMVTVCDPADGYRYM